jgi:anti-anti-sigma factor
MNIEVHSKGTYLVIRVHDELQVIAELSELQLLVEESMQQGHCRVALSFCDASYIYSGAIAVLISLYKKLKNSAGELCLIESHPQLRTIFDYMGITRLIPIYPSEEDLPQL